MRLAIALLAGLVGIVLFPEPALLVELIVLPIAVVVALLGAIYLRRLYNRQRRPRSIFFGMLVESTTAKALLVLWVGYLALGRISAVLEDAGTIDWSLPAPDPRVSAPITGLVITILVLPPALYAAQIYRFRRSSAVGELPETETDVSPKV